MKLKYLPNLITIMRMFLIIPLYFVLIGENYLLSLVLFCAAALSDGIDGFLARRFNWQSRCGAILDPLADKLIILVTTFLLAWEQHLLWIVALAIIARDVIIISGAVIYHFYIGEFTFKPTFVSKINTVLQLLLIFMILTNISSYQLFSAEFMLFSTYMVFLVTVISGVDYVLHWSCRAYYARKGLPQ